MAISKSNFQPKDARTFIKYDDEEEDSDVDELIHKKTGTEALVEFLKTTSPEEFQRAVPNERSSSIFSRIRKPKRTIKPSSSSNHKHIPSSPTVTTKPETRFSSKSLDTPVPFDQSLVLRNKGGVEPVLPNKKRESSVYSGSIRYSASIRSQLSTISHPRRMIDSTHSLPQQKQNKANEELLALREGMDVIETGLLQRLQRLSLSHEPKPSDIVATGLAKEHIQALGITHLLDHQHLINDQTKVRHMQVQTEDITQHHLESISQPTPPPTPKQLKETHKLEEETKDDPEVRAKRAEAALANALDHFEVISGLAYKKLREIWEEKMRWENACMELRDRLLALEQNKPIRGDYFTEEEDELGLSEYPISEN